MAAPGLPTTEPKILITLMGSIGDVARGLTLLPRIKAHWNRAHITWLVEPKSEALVRLSPHVDRIIVFPRGGTLRAMQTALGELRAADYDVALDLQRHLKSGLLTWLSRAPRRIGFARQNAKEANWLFTNETIGPYDDALTNKGKVYHQFLDVLGIPAQSGAFHSDLRVPVRTGVFAVVPEPYVVFVLGSSWESKNWFPSGYVALARRVLSAGKYSLVLSGDRAQQGNARLIAEALNSPRVHNLAGQGGLSELVSIVAGAKVVVGPDSGPGHIAAGLHVPYVALFGATSAQKTAPLGAHVAIVQSAIGCSPCYRRECPGLGRACMRLISPEVVYKSMQSLISSCE